MRKTALLALLGAILPAAGGALAGSFTTGGGDASFRRIEASGGRLTGVDVTGSYVLQKGVAISLAQIAAEAAVASANGASPSGGTGASNLGQPNGAAELDAAGTLSSNTVAIGNNHVTLATIGGLAENALPSAMLGAANGAATLDANASLSAGNAAAAWASSVQRPMAARFADALNVKDFGAVGDGATDSTAAFAAAIGLATGIDLGATINIPQGHYILRQTLVAQLTGDAGVHIRGAGMGETMLEFQIPAANTNQDGIDIVGAPATCVPYCFNWNSPWRGGGLSGNAQGQSSTIEDLTLKTTGGPGYPAGSMISATSGYGQATESQAPWLTIRNIWGSGAGPNSAPVWLNGIRLGVVGGVRISDIFMDEHSKQAAGAIGTEVAPNGVAFIAGAAILLEASQNYSNQTQGVQATDIQTGGFLAGFALGGVTQGNGVSGMGCANDGGNYYCLAIGGGTIIDGDAGADVTPATAYAYGGDDEVFVSATTGLAHGMQVVPSGTAASGLVPYGATVDQIASSATGGFYAVTWTTPAESTTTAINGDLCRFTPPSGSAVTATCSAAAASSLLAVSNASGTIATGMAVADTTNAAAIPSGLVITQVGSGTALMRLPNGTVSAENSFSAGSPSAPVKALVTYAQPGAVVLNDPTGAGGFSATGLDCGHVCVDAPSSPFTPETGYSDLDVSASEAQSTSTPLNVIGGATRATLSGFTWNYGGGVFASVSNSSGVDIFANVIGAAGEAATVPAIALTNTTGSEIYDNFVYGAQPLGTDDQTTNLWGLNYWNGGAHLGLAGSPIALDSPLSGCVQTNGGSAWFCAVSGQVAAATSALLTPIGALPLPATTTAAASAATGATTLVVASAAPFAAGMTVTDAATGAAATVRSVSGATLTFYAPGLSGAVASGDTLGNGYPAIARIGGGIVPQDGSLWAQGACNDSTLANRSMLAMGQQYTGTGSALGSNANNFTTIYASTTAGALFPGLSLSTFPPNLPVPGIEVINANSTGGAAISCGFTVDLTRAP